MGRAVGWRVMLATWHGEDDGRCRDTQRPLGTHDLAREQKMSCSFGQSNAQARALAVNPGLTSVKSTLWRSAVSLYDALPTSTPRHRTIFIPLLDN